jgi:hypothetical protein
MMMKMMVIFPYSLSLWLKFAVVCRKHDYLGKLNFMRPSSIQPVDPRPYEIF